MQAAILLLAAIVLAGCGGAGERVLTLRDWTFVGPTARSKRCTFRRAWMRGCRTRRPSTGFAHTSRCRAISAGIDWTLAFPFLHARATLLANGEPMVGLVPEMREGFRGTDQPRWRIPADVTRAGAIDLELTVSYRHLMNGWLDLPPRLSDTDDGDAAFRFVATFDRAQAAGCLATVSLTSLLYGIIFVLDRRRKAHGWLTVQGSSAAPATPSRTSASLKSSSACTRTRSCRCSCAWA